MNSESVNFISRMKSFNDDFSKEKYRLIAYNSVFKSKYLFLTHFSTDSKFLNSPYREIILNYFVNAERYYPGSSLLLSELIVKKFFGIEEKNIKNIKKNKENLKKYFLQNLDKEIVENFINIIDFSGPDATINCNLTKNKDFEVEKVVYPDFNINIHEDFQEVFFKNQDSSTKNYLVSLYDGYIERESELNSLIEKSKSNNKCPVLIVCRGISDYAVKSLKQILLRNNIFFYPYICKFDNSDPFMFSDIEKILEIKSYNIESGDSLHKSLSENSDFRNLKLFSDKIRILNSSDLLKKEITKQLSDTSDNEVRTYLYKRKNRCSPNNIYIKIPQTKVNLLNSYKSMIKCYNYAAVNGFFEINGKLYTTAEYYNCNKLANRFYNTIKNIGFTIKLGENNGSKKQSKAN